MNEDPHDFPNQGKIRRTFVAGIFASVPLAVTILIIWWVDQKTRVITYWLFHRSIPFVGVLIAVAAIYVTGMITSSLVGRFFLRLLDNILMHLPVVRQLYLGWKQIALTPGGTEGTFSRVVMVPDETGQMHMLGFTSGRVLEGDPPRLCVFIPSAPNPITGRLFFIEAAKCEILQMTPEEAFKVILSTGNYIP
ncbi:MAG: DUF502 domain-containing protein, partial [Tepidisphaeraceae bacterium]